MFLVAKRRIERDILLHELNTVCRESNHQVELLSARGDAIERINPITSFNAWNLSVIIGQQS